MIWPPSSAVSGGDGGVIERELFQQTLGLEETWKVIELKLDLEGKRVEVRVRVQEATLWAEDREQLPIAGYEKHRWRLLDTMQLESERSRGSRLQAARRARATSQKPFRKRHRYGTLVNDLDRGCVLELCEARTTGAACQALGVMGEERLKKVEAVAMDMSAAYEAAVRSRRPQARMVYGRFHVSPLVGMAVDRVRREEAALLSAVGDDTLKKGTRYDWLFNPATMRAGRYSSFEELVLKSTKTSRAWYQCIMFAEFWEHPDRGSASKFFKHWFALAKRSKLKPVVTAARTLKAAHANSLPCWSCNLREARSASLQFERAAWSGMADLKRSVKNHYKHNEKASRNSLTSSDTRLWHPACYFFAD